MDAELLGHKIGAWKLAGQSPGLYHAFVDDLLDADIQPSVYPRVILRRIVKAYANRFIHERAREANSHH